MFKGHSRPVRPRFSIAENVTKEPLKKAQHFQTKNGGKNHGRWFYTCQLPQTKRCDFFIWDDEAKLREEAAVLNNSRNEPFQDPTTPLKDASHGLPSPQTERHIRFTDDDLVETPYTPSKPPRPEPQSAQAVRNKNASQATTVAGTSDEDEEEFFDWPATMNDPEVMRRMRDSESQATMPAPETPRKAPRSNGVESPGKRKFVDFEGINGPPVPANDDVFVTPATSRPAGLFPKTTPLTPAITPTNPGRGEGASQADSQLADDILSSLQNALSVPLFSEAREDIIAICNKYNLQTKGITKGRDVLRDVIKRKDGRIADLQKELDEVRSARDTDRGVIRSLRQEIAMQKQRS